MHGFMPGNTVSSDRPDDSAIPDLAPIAGPTDSCFEERLASPPAHLDYPQCYYLYVCVVSESRD